MTQSQYNAIIKASEKERLAEITKIANRLNRLFNKSFNDVGALLKHAKLYGKSLDPATKKRVEALTNELYERVNIEIRAGVGEAFDSSNKLSNAIEKKILPKVDVSNLKGNTNAVEAFLKRKDGNGFNFSKRIWKHNNYYKKKINDAIADALQNGKSAKQLSKELAAFVSPNAKGKGIYTDPRKNAERLARSEISRAYNEADHIRWRDAWYIKGIKVDLSMSHPKYDSCDSLDNIYPKGFKFSKWHVHCLCYAIPILVSERVQSLMQDYKLGLRDKPPKVRYINAMPTQTLKWVERNSERIKGWSNRPYFITENANYFKGLIQ